MRDMVAAWLAHAYTALGLLCAAAIFGLVVEGGDGAFRVAFAVMVAATLVDATDGWIARRARVGEVLPGFDGRRLDDLIDFQTYTCLPLALLWRAGVFPGADAAWLLVPLVASAYGFCQVAAKTDDHYFLGFPSYWNIVAFYLFVLRLRSPWPLAIVLALSVLTFVPTRYLYTTSAGRWSLVTNSLSAAWLASLVAILWWWNLSPRWLVVGSLAFPAYYMAASWAVTIHLRRNASRQ
jgi:phosphatidylcholine synthase